MTWSILTLLGILAFSPKNLLYRTLMKEYTNIPNKVIGALLTLIGAALVL
jgi:hypothetical protein